MRSRNLLRKRYKLLRAPHDQAGPRPPRFTLLCYERKVDGVGQRIPQNELYGKAVTSRQEKHDRHQVTAEQQSTELEDTESFS